MRICGRPAKISIGAAQLLCALSAVDAALAQTPENHPVIMAPRPMVMPQMHAPAAPVLVAPVHAAPSAAVAPATAAAPVKPISPAVKLNPQTPAATAATAATAASPSHLTPVQTKSDTKSAATPAAKQQDSTTDPGTTTKQISGLKKADPKPAAGQPGSNPKSGAPGTAATAPLTAEQKAAHNKVEGAKEEMYEAKKSGDQKRIDRAQKDIDAANADVQTADKDAAAPKTPAQAKALADLTAAKKELEDLNHQEMLGEHAGNKLDRAAAEAKIAKALAEVDAADAGTPPTEAQAKTQADIAEAQKLLATANEKKAPADESALDHDVERDKADRSALQKDQNAIAQDNQALASGDPKAANQLAEDQRKAAADAAKEKKDADTIKTDKTEDIGTRILKDKEKLQKDDDAVAAAKGDPAKMQTAQEKANAERRTVDRDEKKQKDIKDREADIGKDITALKIDTDLGNDQGSTSAENRLKSDEKKLDGLLGIPDPDQPKGKKE